MGLTPPIPTSPREHLDLRKVKPLSLSLTLCKMTGMIVSTILIQETATTNHGTLRQKLTRYCMVTNIYHNKNLKKKRETASSLYENLFKFIHLFIPSMTIYQVPSMCQVPLQGHRMSKTQALKELMQEPLCNLTKPQATPPRPVPVVSFHLL